MVYITGDTHADDRDLRWNWFNEHLTSDDTLIITGDFGFDWHKLTVNTWECMERKYTTLFCDGNHENFDVLTSLPLVEKYGDVVGKFCDNTYRLLTGHMYLIEGERYFVFGGAMSVDKAWRVIEEQKTNSPRTLWWEEEVPSSEDFSLAKKTLEENNYKFDYFISHTCNSQLKSVILGGEGFVDPTESMLTSLEYLIRENGGSWKESFFGHFHQSRSFGKYHCLYGDVVDTSGKSLIDIKS